MGRFWDGGSYSQPTAGELKCRSEASRKEAETAADGSKRWKRC